MGSWIKPNTFTGIPEIEPGTALIINGYKINKPRRFKNLAHERAFEIALVLAQKKPSYTHSQRMGDIIITTTAPVIMTTSECIDVIMFNGIKEIQLKIDVANPNIVAHRAMEYVPRFFESGNVQVKKRSKGNKMWYLEISME